MSDRRALDEENFEEAEQQAFKVTQTSEVSKREPVLFFADIDCLSRSLIPSRLYSLPLNAMIFLPR